jgi:hypothetical protein
MTISGVVARFLAEEHKYIPFPKEIHLLGRQTISMSVEQLHAIFSVLGITPREVVVEYDIRTRQAKTDNPSMNDATFFKMFGVESIRAVDHSDFEGADIVFDLTKKLPPQYESCADLIFDGSVMDNIFDPSSGMHNVAGMLRPGGRYIGINVGSTKWLPSYVAFNPYWFFDFFIANGFRDVKIYVIDFKEYPNASRGGKGTVCLLDAKANHREVHSYPVSNGAVAILIIAEKDLNSISDGRTSQGCYRLTDEWEVFDSNIARILKSKRPVVSLRKQADTLETGNGFVYVGNVDGYGLCSRDPAETYNVLERGEVNLGALFAGYDWGAIEAHGESSWRWIDDSRKASVLLLPLAPGKAYTVEAKIHTCKDPASITALRAFCDGILIADQTIQSDSGGHKLVMSIPESVTEGRLSHIKLGFSAKNAATGMTIDGRNVALSKIRFYPQGEKVNRSDSPMSQSTMSESSVYAASKDTITQRLARTLQVSPRLYRVARKIYRIIKWKVSKA